jgi:hypothetical protein
MEMFDIDDTFCVAHGGQQLAFWNAHHDERGFAPIRPRCRVELADDLRGRALGRENPVPVGEGNRRQSNLSKGWDVGRDHHALVALQSGPSVCRD